MQATAAAEWALENGFTRAITFSSPGPYFGYNPEVFTEVFTAGGGEIITDQPYVPVEDTDFSAQVNEIAGLADGDGDRLLGNARLPGHGTPRPARERRA